jgi:sugar lactone lactonase YvrE
VMKWMKGAKEGIVVAGGNEEGEELTQLCYPNGVWVDDMGTVYVAEWGNNRVTR